MGTRLLKGSINIFSNPNAFLKITDILKTTRLTRLDFQYSQLFTQLDFILQTVVAGLSVERQGHKETLTLWE